MLPVEELATQLKPLSFLNKKSYSLADNFLCRDEIMIGQEGKFTSQNPKSNISNHNAL